jgi:DNA-binding transcriptional LysR family regulator
VAIRFGPLADSALTARKLGANGRVVVASPDYLALHGTPQEPEDLRQLPEFQFSPGRAGLAVPPHRVRWCRAGFRPGSEGTILANNGETLAIWPSRDRPASAHSA